MSFAESIDKSYGFIPLWRSITKWEWYEDKNTVAVYEYCLMRAQYKDTRVKGILVKKGSFITSRGNLAENTNLSVQNVRTALKNLVSTNDITIKTNKKGTVITVENYDYIMKKSDELTNKLTKSQPSANQELTTNNKDNKDNNDDVVCAGAPTTDYSDDFLKFWNAYSKKRKKYQMDTFAYWNEQNYTSQEVDQIIYGAKKYSEEMKDDKHMVYARTFLEDEKWKEYSRRKSSDDLPIITPEMLERYMNG